MTNTITEKANTNTDKEVTQQNYISRDRHYQKRKDHSL